MVEVNIYPACLKCDDPNYSIDVELNTYYSKEYPERNEKIYCSTSRICTLIDGQEPIEIGE